MTTIGIAHPGAMGGAIATMLAAAGHDVRWAGERRSAATQARAAAAGITDCGSFDALVGAADLFVSICPPDAALDVATDVAALGFDGTYLDANAVSPARAAEIAAVVTATGASYLDGGVIGLPPVPGGPTRIYLSGPRATEVRTTFNGVGLSTVALGDSPTAASALKMCYAAWTKGSAALLQSVRALAAANGVDDALVAEWDHSQPGVAERSAGAARGTAPKAWRFVGEMEEIAATFAAAGLPDGFHLGAADFYARLAAFKDQPDVTLDDVIRAALAP